MKTKVSKKGGFQRAVLEELEPRVLLSATTPLDMSSAFNLDAWCSAGEYNALVSNGTYDLYEAQAGTANDGGYFPLSEGVGAFVFQQSYMMIGAGESYDGTTYNDLQATPADGVLTGADGRVYHIASHDGNATLSGDWLGVASPVAGDGTMATKLNAIGVFAAHSKAQAQVSSVTATLDLEDQGQYKNINFVLGGFNATVGARGMQIVAVYTDSSEEVLYAWPSDDVQYGPAIDDSASDTVPAGFTAIDTFSTGYYKSAGSTGGMLANDGTLYEFSTALALNGGKTLQAIRFEDTMPDDDWSARGLSIFAATVESGETYYVAVDGDDSTGDGSAGNPWQTIQYAVNTAEEGDTINVTSGTYRERVTFTQSELTLQAVGEEPVVISGSEDVSSGWTLYSGDIYSKTINWEPEALFVDGERLEFSKMEWQTAEDADFREITDSNVFTSTDPNAYVGQHIFYRQIVNMVMDRSVTVVSYDPTTHTVTVDSDLCTNHDFPPTTGDLYYIYNAPDLIDESNEWAYTDNGDDTYTLYLRTSDDANPSSHLVEVPYRNSAINLRGYDDIVIDGFTITQCSGDHSTAIITGRGTQEHATDESLDWVSRNITVRNNVVYNNVSGGIVLAFTKDSSATNNLVTASEMGIIVKQSDTTEVSENEIYNVFNDAIIVSNESMDTTIARNYIHDTDNWAHPDGIQTYSTSAYGYEHNDGVIVDSNLIVNTAQSVIFQETDNVVLTNNVFIGTQATMFLYKRNVEGMTVANNTMALSNLSTSNIGVPLVANAFTVYDNIFNPGRFGPMLSVYAGHNYTADYNLFYHDSSSDSSDDVVTWHGTWSTLAEYQTASSQDANGLYADPMFVNAPVAVRQMDGHNLYYNTTSRLYIETHGGAGDFEVGDHLEYRFDGVDRVITAAGTDAHGDYVEFSAALDDVPEKEYLLVNWKNKTVSTMDFSLAAGSPAAGTGTGGLDRGASLDLSAYFAGDFNGDSIRDIPTDPFDVEPLSGIITEDFESGIYGGTGNWDPSGRPAGWNLTTGASITGDDDPFAGDYHLKLTEAGVATRYLAPDPSMTSLSFNWRANDFEAGERAYFKIYDGSTWHTLLMVEDGQDDDQWHTATFDISGFNFSASSWQVRISANMGEADDYFYVDNISFI